MLRTFAAAATVAALALPAFAQDTMSSEDEMTMQQDQMTMLRERLATVLEECNQVNEDEAVDQLTLAQVSGIVLSASSSSGSDQCQEVEAILNQ